MVTTMKKIISLFLFILFLTITYSKAASAQSGFLPEFLGNAAGVQTPGLCIKFFPSYYYQSGIDAHDAEAAFEPQYWIAGFTGDLQKDQIQFVVHMPVGYRRQRVASGQIESVTGIGNLTTTIEYYYHIIDEEDLEWWFDNGITGGYPTATENNNIFIGGRHYPVAIGSSAYSVGWYQENMIRYKRFLASFQPVTFTYGFRDDRTGSRSGLSLSVMNGAVGYGVNSWAHLGIGFGLLLGNVVGSDDGAGNSLPTSVRFFTGPAALLSFGDNTAIQISVLIDAVTRNVNRGQGIALAIWHHF
jgi:hypothetical protein